MTNTYTGPIEIVYVREKGGRSLMIFCTIFTLKSDNRKTQKFSR